MKIVLVGAGNLATNIGHALLDCGHDIIQVYSRTYESASLLAEAVGGSPITELDKISPLADAYIVSVKDSAIAEVIPSLCKGREEKVFLHTAGSVPMDVFKGMAEHYGVFYPLQTFSKFKILDFRRIPCFVEANDTRSSSILSKLANDVSSRVYALSSADRKYLHLSAVFACNFVNHCYDISSVLLDKHHIPFDVMLPLIDETARKVHAMSPREAQTGPAARYDQNVIRAQSDLLKDNPLFRQIYECMSISINHAAQKMNKDND